MRINFIYKLYINHTPPVSLTLHILSCKKYPYNIRETEINMSEEKTMKLSVKLLLLLCLTSIAAVDSFASYSMGCFGPVSQPNYHYRGNSPQLQGNMNYRTSMSSPNYNYSAKNGYNNYNSFEYNNWDRTKEVAGGALVGGALGWGASRLLGFDSGWGIGLGALFGGIASYSEETERQQRNAYVLPMLANTTYTTEYYQDDLSYESSYEAGRYNGKVPGTRIQNQRVQSASGSIANS
jgi:hypothetical protein